MARSARSTRTLGVLAALLGAWLSSAAIRADLRQDSAPVVPTRGPVHIDGDTWIMEVPPLGVTDIEIGFGVSASARLALGTGGRATPPDPIRPNLYLVGPGRGWVIEGRRTNHDRILDHRPRQSGFVEVDLYGTVVLDPALQNVRITSAGALVDYRLTSFQPAEQYGPDLAPGKDALLTFFHLNQERYRGLEQFLNPDGTYPRTLVWPLGVAIRARFKKG